MGLRRPSRYPRYSNRSASIPALCRWPRPATAVAVIETNIIIGKARNVGLRVAAGPEKKAAAMTPRLPRDMRTGIRRTSGLGDEERGSAGGAEILTSAVGTTCFSGRI